MTHGSPNQYEELACAGQLTVCERSTPTLPNKEHMTFIIGTN